MPYIKTIDYDQADTALKRMYDRVKGPNNNVDNVLLIHSLRPHTLTGHMTLYKAVLHNANNELPKWYLEALGVYVSYLNKCDYCVQHHFAGFARLVDDAEESNFFMECVMKDDLNSFFKNHYSLGAEHAKKLTLNHTAITKDDIDQLKEAGFSEGKILEINQVTSYFNYVNRMVVGLGVTIEGDVIGLSPNDSDDPKNWNHN